ncbi:Alkali-sensitive linkage protein 1-like protein 1 [Verticillium dahliae]
MLNQSMTYLDGLDLVEGYAWFGAFRTDNANEWTGDSVSMFNNDGALTEVGATFLGGEANGFEKGMKGGSAKQSTPITLMAALVVALGLLHYSRPLY